MSLFGAYLLGTFPVDNCPIDNHLRTWYSDGISTCDRDCCFCDECLTYKGD